MISVWTGSNVIAKQTPSSLYEQQNKQLHIIDVNTDTIHNEEGRHVKLNPHKAKKYSVLLHVTYLTNMYESMAEEGAGILANEETLLKFRK